MPSLAILLLGGYAFVDSFSLGLSEVQRYYYVVLCLITAIATAISPIRSKEKLFSSRILQLWVIATVVGFAMILFQTARYPMYIIGDALTFSLPLLFLAYSLRKPDLFSSSKGLNWLLTFLLSATFAATLFPFITDGGTSRYKEPSILLMALTWVSLTTKGAAANKLAAIIPCFAVLVFTLFSGARFALLIWLAMGVVLLFCGYATTWSRRVGLAGVGLVVFACVTGLVGGDISNKLSEMRIGSIIERLQTENLFISLVEDGSMQNRILESDDALHTRFTYQGWPEFLLGSGHGATFSTGYAYYGDRALDNGLVHHIHFGLVLLYYRYGVLGVLLYAGLLFAAVKHLYLLRSINQNNPLFKPSLIFCLGSLGYLFNLLLFNQLVDPVGSFTTAGQIAIWLRLETLAKKEHDKKRLSIRDRNLNHERRGPLTGQLRPNLR